MSNNQSKVWAAVPQHTDPTYPNLAGKIIGVSVLAFGTEAEAIAYATDAESKTYGIGWTVVEVGTIGGWFVPFGV